MNKKAPKVIIEIRQRIQQKIVDSGRTLSSLHREAHAEHGYLGSRQAIGTMIIKGLDLCKLEAIEDIIDLSIESLKNKRRRKIGGPQIKKK